MQNKKVYSLLRFLTIWLCSWWDSIVHVEKMVNLVQIQTI